MIGSRIVAGGLVLALTGAVATAAPPELAPPPQLPEPARQLVRKRMASHGEAMSHLLWDVLFLLYDRAAVDAQAIADRAQPLDRHDPQLEGLTHVFDLQERLRYRALGVADAARAHDGALLGTAFGELNETCVHCHVAYLNVPGR